MLASLSSYQLVTMSLDRVISIKAPVFYQTNLRLGTARFGPRVVSLALVLFTVVCSCLFVWSAEINPAGYCGNATSTVVREALVIITLIYSEGVPFLILLVSNFVFSSALLSRRRVLAAKDTDKGDTLTAEAAAQKKQRKEEAIIERGYNRMLFSLTISYLVLFLGSCVPLLMADQENKLQLLFARDVHNQLKNLSRSTNILFCYLSVPMFRAAFNKAVRKMLCMYEQRK